MKRANSTRTQVRLALIKKFCTLWHNDAVANQPIRANSDNFECEIGQRWYGEAKAHWQALTQNRGTASGPATANLGPTSLGPGGGTTPRPMPPARLGGPKIT